MGKIVNKNNDRPTESQDETQAHASLNGEIPAKRPEQRDWHRNKKYKPKTCKEIEEKERDSFQSSKWSLQDIQMKM